MQDDRFEWDDDKARNNLFSHKISFEVARLVFEDENSIDKIDDRNVYDEDRSNRVGIVGSKLIIVCYTYREDRIRIISARKATKREQKAYFER